MDKKFQNKLIDTFANFIKKSNLDDFNEEDFMDDTVYFAVAKEFPAGRIITKGMLESIFGMFDTMGELSDDYTCYTYRGSELSPLGSAKFSKKDIEEKLDDEYFIEIDKEDMKSAHDDYDNISIDEFIEKYKKN